MNRRSFLTGLFGATAAVAVAPLVPALEAVAKPLAIALPPVDSVFDSTAYLQSLVDANAGGRVVFPAGRWHIFGTITVPPFTHVTFDKGCHFIGEDNGVKLSLGAPTSVVGLRLTPSEAA